VVKRIRLSFNLKSIITVVKHKLAEKLKTPKYLEFDRNDYSVIDEIIQKKLTMTTKTNLAFTLFTAKQLVVNQISGDFVEVGCWGGGHLIAAAQGFNGAEREVYGFDTFKKMTLPNSTEYNFNSKILASDWHQNHIYGQSWEPFDYEKVLNNYSEINKNKVNLNLIEGDIRSTLYSNSLPRKISFLRVDIDWYELVNIALEKFYPFVSPGGVIVIDDYGSWSGAFDSVNQFRQKHNISSPMFPIDSVSRFWVKQND
jgi:O-methyltransferase